MSTNHVSPRKQAIQQQVQFTLNELKSQSFNELSGLPATSSIDIRFGEVTAKLVTHRETQADGRVLIVVQYWPAGAETSFIWRDVYAEGFWMSPNGTITVLPDRLRYAYM